MHFHLQKSNFCKLRTSEFYSDRQRTPLWRRRVPIYCADITLGRVEPVQGTLRCVTQYHPQQQTALNVDRLVRAETYTSSRGVSRTGSVIQFPFSATPATGYESDLVHETPNCKQQCDPWTSVHTIHYITRGLPDHSCFNARNFIVTFGIPLYFL